MTSILQSSLTGGELSTSLHGRVDLARYQNSLKACRNFRVIPYGGAENRSGTRYIVNVKNHAAKVRLIPFQFSTEQTYVLEFGNLYVRVIKDGGQVVYSSGPNVGLPVEVVTPYTTAQLPYLNFTQSADVMTICHPSHAPRQLSRTAHDAWTLAEFEPKNGPFKGINTRPEIRISVSDFTGTVTLTSASDVFSAANIGQTIYLEQLGYGTPWEVTKAVDLGDIRRSDGKYYRALNAGTTGTLRPTHTENSWSDGAVEWEYLHSGFGIVEITGYTSAKVVTGRVIVRIPEGVQTSSTSTFAVSEVAESGGGTITATVTGHGLTVPTIVSFSLVQLNPGDEYTPPFEEIALSVSCLATPVDANTLTIDTLWGGYYTGLTGSLTVSGTYKWALGAWGGDQGYPRCVAYHQQRQVFGSTPAQPETLWMSRIGSYTDFGKSTPVLDDDAITNTLGGTQVSEIRGILPLDGLVLFTSGGVQAMGAGADDVLNPSNQAAKGQGARGSSYLPPLSIGDGGLYLQDKGKVVRAVGYEFAKNRYTGADLTVMASHLVAGNLKIEEWAWHESPYGCVWAVRNDGVLLSITYMAEQEIVGWARHDTDGLFESVAVVSEGDEDVLYVAVKRTIGGATKRYIERMETRVISDIREAFFVDSGLTYDGRNTTATTVTLSGGTNWDHRESLTATASSAIFAGASDLGDMITFESKDGQYYKLRITEYVSPTVVNGILNKQIPAEYRNVARADWAFSRNSFSGLDHLEGKTVSILGDGLKQAQKVVTGGSITLENPAFMVSVGLPIVADLQTLRLTLQTPETVLDKRKNVTSVTLMVDETRSIWVGRDFDNLYESKTRAGENYDQPPGLVSGLVNVPIPTKWEDSGSVCIRQTDPLPIKVLAIIPDIELGGKA